MAVDQANRKPYQLDRQALPITASLVESRNPQSTASLHNTGSVDSTGRGIGITPVVFDFDFVVARSICFVFHCYKV